jgi:hypothetical protein
MVSFWIMGNYETVAVFFVRLGFAAGTVELLKTLAGSAYQGSGSRTRFAISHANGAARQRFAT